MKKIKFGLFLLIFALGAYFRFTGLNWDSDHHLHPDERFLTMVANGLSWTKSISEYFDTNNSSLNPHNRGFNFYVYGTFPMILVKWVAETLGKSDYNQLTLVGRTISAVLDLGTMVLVFLIARFIVLRSFAPFWAMFFYAVMPLPIQLSHFFTADPYLTLFLTLSFYFLIRYSPILLGVSFGLALSAKISAFLFLPIIFLGFTIRFFKNKNITQIIIFGLIFSLFTIITIRLFYPYLFNGVTINPKLIANWRELKNFDGPDTAFPPALQWIPTQPIIYPLIHNVLWGLGIPLGVISVVGLFYFRNKLVLTWILLLFLYQGVQFAKALRYFYPIYPFFAIVSGFAIYHVVKYLRSRFHWYLLDYLIIGLLVFIPIWWAFVFTGIYRRPHTRVAATNWIYANIPPGSTLTYEIWDDPLPFNSANYTLIGLPLYDPDSQEKWQKLSLELSRVDYIILASNRLWRSLMAIPDKYPATSRYYRLLFSGSLGFKQVATFTSYPLFNDDWAEESFTVYDHPKVLIFQKTQVLTPTQIYNLIYE